MRYSAVVFTLFSMVSALTASDQNLVSIKVEKISLNPMDSAWDKAPSVTVMLSPQKLLVPQGGGAVSSVEMQSARTSSDIYFRFRWKDRAKNSKFELSKQFVDGCAIQFPLNKSQLPAPFMGEKNKPVNIWRWSAAMEEKDRFPKAYADYHRPDAIEKTHQYPDRPEDLVAEGFGTLGRRELQPLEGRSVWFKGQWTVVIKRPLKASGGTQFASGSLVPFAVAIWDGESKDRDGAKSFSVWQNLLLDRPAPEIPKNIIERGERVYQRYGCGLCHGAAGKGGVPNPGAQTDPIPPLERVAEGFSEDEVKTVIRKGRQPEAKDEKGEQPKLWMNSWSSIMDEDELDALVDYLFSLMPKGAKEDW